MRYKYLDGVLGSIAFFTTMEPILGAGSKNLNQRLDVAVVSFVRMPCKKKPDKTFWTQKNFVLKKHCCRPLREPGSSCRRFSGYKLAAMPHPSASSLVPPDTSHES
jgi:hypothetical protein